MGAIFHNGDYVGSVPPIDDSSVSDKTLWSSQKTKEEIDEVGSIFDNLSYSTQELTASDKCNIEAGGYCKIGKLVIVNIRVRLTDQISANSAETLVSGFPLQSTSFNIVAVATSFYTDASAYLNGSALIWQRASGIGANNVITFSTIYITR